VIVHRFATAQDTAALTAVWQHAFPEDTAEEIADFLAKVTLAEECLVAVEDGAVVSMVFLLPAMLQGETPLPLQYIYAAATLPSHRGRGIFGALLKQALVVARQRGQVASFLRPAQPSLCHYYAAFGYEPFFYCDRLCGAAASSPMRVKRVSAEEYVKFRTMIAPPLAVEWPARLLDNTVITENACAVCVPDGTRLLIRELCCADGQYEKTCAALAHHFGCDTYESRIPATKAGEQPFGLLCPLQSMTTSVTSPPYMGVALD
jgi:predicted N-acetyltransferase YhbS